MKNKLILVFLFIVSTVLFSSCGGHRDCQGSRHKIKTDMGWM